MSETQKQDIEAALAARRDLGPEYDEAVAARLADRMHEEIARQVQARLEQERGARPVPQRMSSGQRVAITIVAMAMGLLTTAVVVLGHAAALGIVIWIAVALIGLAVNAPDRRR